jgi:hypothetical protein
MSRLRVYGLRGLAASVAGPVHSVPQPRVPAPQPAPVVRLPNLVGASPEVIADRLRSLVVLFAPDGSGSMQPLHGTDPHGARYAACHAVLDLMRRHGGGRAGVVHWGDAAPPELALAPVLVRRRRRQLEHALAIRPQLGGTDPAVALARVRQLVPVIAPGETLAVLLLTDGQDRGPSLEQELEALPAGTVHLVLVDPSGNCWGQEAAWRALPWGSFTRLDSFDPQRVAVASGAALGRAIGLELSALPSTHRSRGEDR